MLMRLKLLFQVFLTINRPTNSCVYFIDQRLSEFLEINFLLREISYERGGDALLPIDTYFEIFQRLTAEAIL